MGCAPDPRRLPDMTTQSTTAPGAMLPLTFRTLFRPSDAIFEEPRVESGAGAIYRPFHAL